jgi:hypothetical protein
VDGPVGVGVQQEPEVEVDVPVGPRVLVDVHEDRGRAGMAGDQTRLLLGLPQGREGRVLPGLDVPAGLEPAVQPPVPMQQEAARRVEHEGGGRHVGRQRRPGERVRVPAQQAPQVRDRVLLLGVGGGMTVEQRGQRAAARIRAQRTRFPVTRPASSRS